MLRSKAFLICIFCQLHHNLGGNRSELSSSICQLKLWKSSNLSTDVQWVQELGPESRAPDSDTSHVSLTSLHCASLGIEGQHLIFFPQSFMWHLIDMLTFKETLVLSYSLILRASNSSPDTTRMAYWQTWAGSASFLPSLFFLFVSFLHFLPPPPFSLFFSPSHLHTT